jgi:hypothetical protein
MSFFAPPRRVGTTVFTRLPDRFRKSRRSAWADSNGEGAEIDSFLEGPSFDREGRLYVTDIPFGRAIAGSDAAACARWQPPSVPSSGAELSSIAIAFAPAAVLERKGLSGGSTAFPVRGRLLDFSQIRRFDSWTDHLFVGEDYLIESEIIAATMLLKSCQLEGVFRHRRQRSTKGAPESSLVHPQVYNLFNQEWHLVTRPGEMLAWHARESLHHGRRAHARDVYPVQRSERRFDLHLLSRS